MKTLAATSRGQGERPGDFCWTVEGELVRLGFVCDRSRHDPDEDVCGCARSFDGLASHRATTTAIVVEVDLSREQLVDTFIDSLVGAGWDPSPGSVTREVCSLTAAVREFPVGTIVLRYLDDIRVAT